MSVSSPTPNLDVISSPEGDHLHPDDVLNGEGIKSFLAWAREEYDHVIIDTPPLGVVSDALPLVNLCDGVLIAARPHVSGKSATRFTAMRVAEAGGPLVGVVINDARISAKRAMSGAYGSAQAYGYYAYNDAYASPARSSRMPKVPKHAAT